MDDYLAKPISTAQLAAMLAQWLPSEFGEAALSQELERTQDASSAAAQQLNPLLADEASGHTARPQPGDPDSSASSSGPTIPETDKPT